MLYLLVMQLPRSSDFADLYALLKIRYESVLERPLIFTIIQLLWDRLEPIGACSRLFVFVYEYVLVRFGSHDVFICGFRIALTIFAC